MIEIRIADTEQEVKLVNANKILAYKEKEIAAVILPY